MMNLFIEQLADDPKGTAIGVISAIAIIGGVGIGISRGAFNPDPLQAQLETKQQNHALQKQSIALANERYDAGCEGVFYMKPGSSTYQPLTDGSYQSARRKNSTPTGVPAAAAPQAAMKMQQPVKGRMLTQHTGLPPRVTGSAKPAVKLAVKPSRKIR